jgi:trigger factor
MKFSFKSKPEINQSLDIVVHSKEIEEQVLNKLKAAQKDAKLKGFRKGKAPMDVVTSVYGPEIRQDVLWDLASKSFSKLSQHPLEPYLFETL